MEIIIVIVLILISGLLSMAEIALISSRKSSLSRDAKNGSRSAQVALDLANEPDRFLPTTQTGITITAILMGLYSGDIVAPGIVQAMNRWGIPVDYAELLIEIIVIILVTYLALIFGELVPKRIGMTIAESIAKATAIPMNFLSKIATPLVWLSSKNTTFIIKLLGIKASENKITEEEIKSMIQEGTVGGEVQEVEQDIVERVFSLGDRKVSSIMSHRNEIVWLDATLSNEQLRLAVQHDLCDLYPVSKGNLDNMIGVVYLKDLFGKLENPEFDLLQVLRPAQYFHENMEVYKALGVMKEKRVEYGLIWDEYGSCQGIITLKDLLEALVGIIPNDHETSNIIQQKKGGWLVNGQCSFFDFLTYFDSNDILHRNGHNTVGGLILNQLEHIPQEGEQLKWHEFSFEVVDMDGARIDKVLVKRIKEKDTGNEK